MLNLYEILEKVSYEQLIEEGRDPVEVLHYKFQYIPDSIIDGVIDADPTKKKSYSQWALSKWDDESKAITKAVKNGRINKLFNNFKVHSNEIQPKDFNSFERALETYAPIEDTVLKKASGDTVYLEILGREVSTELANDYDIVYESSEWVVAVPNTFEADAKLGNNTEWCTAGYYTQDDRYYVDYLSRYPKSKFYVNFDFRNGESREGIDYPYTRYQFHFESHQFMNIEDDPVYADDIDAPDEVQEFYYSINEDYKIGGKTEEEKAEEYFRLRGQDAIILNDDLYINRAWHDDYEYRPIEDDDDWYIFSSDDDIDPIDNNEVNPNIEESIKYKSEDVIVIEGKEKETLVVVYKQQRRQGWFGWDTLNACDFCTFGENGIIACIGRNGGFNESCLLDNGKACDIRGEIDEYQLDKIFENTTVGTDKIYFEILTTNNKYEGHWLFAYDGDDVECLIENDVPAEGKGYYIADENGIVHGMYKSYDIHNGNDKEETYKLALAGRLTDGNFLVKDMYEQSDNYGLYTIMDGNTRQLINPNVWFKDLRDNSSESFYVGDTQGGFIILYKDSMKAPRYYLHLNGGNRYGNCIAGLREDNKVDLIDKGSGEIVLGGVRMHPVLKTDGGKVPLVDGETTKIFDINSRKFCYEDVENIEPLKIGFSTENCFSGQSKATNKIAVVCYASNFRIDVDDIENSSEVRGIYLKNDGKINFATLIYGNLSSNLVLVAGKWCDAIVQIKEIRFNSRYCLIGNVGGRYFAWDTTINGTTTLVNENGFKIKPYISYSFLIFPYIGQTNYLSFKFYFELITGNAGKFSHIEYNKMAYKSIPEDCPVAVQMKQMYNEITGQGQIAEARVRNKFMDLNKRLNEVKKRNCNELHILS